MYSAQYSPLSTAAERSSRGSSPISDALRPSRKQVSRACDWCRARRIKCENERPCRACRQRGIPCAAKATDDPRSLPQALREIERLKVRIGELEAELKDPQASSAAAAPYSIPTPSLSTTSAPSSGSESADPPRRTLQRDPQQSITYALSAPTTASAQWDGIFVATARSEQTSYYGPSSAFYFISRIGAYISKTFQQPVRERSMQPRAMNHTLADPMSAAEPGTNAASPSGAKEPGPAMSRAQEEYFLSTYWEGLHCGVPILDEADFRRHYNSLWEQSGSIRKDSALVDLVLAVCIQCASTFILHSTTQSAGQPEPTCDATIAGRWQYRRGRSLLAADMEAPSLATVQCEILSVIYVCCASFQNTAHTALAHTIRHATILGLHREPPASLPLRERELRKRIWWALCTIETNNSFKMGRPFAFHPSQVSVALPSDDASVALSSGSSLGTYGADAGAVTWLSYALHNQRFSRTLLQVYDAFWEQSGEILAARGLSSPYKHPDVLEQCADVLTAQMPALQQWLDQVPAGLKTARQRGGQPFSVDRTPLAIDPQAPTWLQRQRLYLEILYHTLVGNCYRPFISFYHCPDTHHTPATERHAAACAHHCVATILIMHQAVRETTLMSGWHEFFLHHWNATLAVAGFLLARPLHPSAAPARDALEKSIEVCDIFGAHFGVAASAASIARGLLAKADEVSRRMHSGLSAAGGPRSAAAPPAAAAEQVPDQAAVDNTEGWNSFPAPTINSDEMQWLDPRQPEDPEQFGEFMDWALTVDSYNSLERFFADSNGRAF